MLRAMKRKAQKVRTAADKKRYIENQARKMDRNPTGCEKIFCDLLAELKINYETQKIVQGKILIFLYPKKTF